MPEIDRLTAQVEVDTARANRSLDKTDEKADEVAENRTGVIKLIIDDDDIDAFKKRHNRSGGILGGILGGDGDAIPVLEVHQLTDALGEATDGLQDMWKEGDRASKAIFDVGEAGDKGGGGMLRFTTGLTSSSGGFIALTGGAGAALIPLTGMVAVIGVLGPAIVALAGGVVALGSAFSTLIGIIFALPTLLGTIAAAAIVLLGAFDGIGEALAEQSAAQEDVKAKGYALSGAILGLASSELALERATRQAANARRDAAEAIEDAQFAATSAQLGEERAILALEAAYKRLAAVQNPIIDKTEEITKVTDFFTGKQFEVARITYDSVKSQEDLRDATLGVKEAELQLLMAQDRREDTAIALADLQSRGIENSDILIDSQLALAQANLGVAQSQLAIADSLNALTGEGSAYNKLSEDGQSLVDLIGELRPLWEEFKTSMQEIILPAAIDALNNLKPILEDLDVLLTPIAEALGVMFNTITERIGEDTFIAKLSQFFNEHDDDIIALGESFADIAEGLLNLALEAKPLTDQLTESFGKIAQLFLDWTEGETVAGDLGSWFEDSARVLESSLDLMIGLMEVATGFIKAALPTGEFLLDRLVENVQQWSDYVNSEEGQQSLGDFFRRITEPLMAIGDLITEIVNMSVEVFGSQAAMDTLTTVANVLKDDILPVVLGFFDALFQSGLLEEIALGLGEMFQSLGELERIGVLDQLMGALRITNMVVRLIFGALNGLLALIPDNALTFGIDSEELGVLVDAMLAEAERRIVEFFTELPETIKTLLAGAFDGMFDGIIDAFADVWNPIAETINDALSRIPDWLPGDVGTLQLPTIDKNAHTTLSGSGGGGAFDQARLDAILAGLPASPSIPPGGRPNPWAEQPITHTSQYQFDINVNGQLDPIEFANWMEWQLSSTPTPPPPTTGSIEPSSGPVFGQDVIPGYKGPQ